MSWNQAKIQNTVTKAKEHKAKKEEKKAAEKQKEKKIRDSRPEFDSIKDKKTGGLQDKYKVTPGKVDAPTKQTAGKYTAEGVTADKMADPTKMGALTDAEKSQFKLRDEGFLKNMRAEGNREAGTPSAWRNLQQKKIGRQAGDAQASVAGKQRQAMDRMAMRGGSSAGASERMTQAGVRDSLAAQQQAYGMGLDADIADENKRMQSLRDLSGVEMGLAQGDTQSQQFNIGNQLASERFDIGNQMSTDKFNIGNKLSADQFTAGANNAASQFNIGQQANADRFNIGNEFAANQFNTSNQFAADQFNTGNLIGDTRAQGMFDMGLYSEQMRELGAQKTANAMPKSSGGKK